jgi:hypothetical protein
MNRLTCYLRFTKLILEVPFIEFASYLVTWAGAIAMLLLRCFGLLILGGELPPSSNSEGIFSRKTPLFSKGSYHI